MLTDNVRRVQSEIMTGLTLESVQGADEGPREFESGPYTKCRFCGQDTATIWSKIGGILKLFFRHHKTSKGKDCPEGAEKVYLD